MNPDQKRSVATHPHKWKWSPIGSVTTWYCEVEDCDRVKRRMPDGSHSYSNGKAEVQRLELRREMIEYMYATSPEEIGKMIARNYTELSGEAWERLVGDIAKVVKWTREHIRTK